MVLVSSVGSFFFFFLFSSFFVFYRLFLPPYTMDSAFDRWKLTDQPFVKFVLRFRFPQDLRVGISLHFSATIFPAASAGVPRFRRDAPSCQEQTLFCCFGFYRLTSMGSLLRSLFPIVIRMPHFVYTIEYTIRVHGSVGRQPAHPAQEPVSFVLFF